jgi:hypothetical protein
MTKQADVIQQDINHSMAFEVTGHSLIKAFKASQILRIGQSVVMVQGGPASIQA